MKAKPKPCKGITSETRGLGCGIVTMHRVYGLGKFCGCYADWLLNTEAGKQKLDKAKLKATKPRMELEQAAKEHKERNNINTHLNTTKDVVHAHVRKRDEGKPCISCGTPWHKDFQAGHYYKAELYTSLKFDTDNIHGQCVQCNIRLEGNLNSYELNLPDRIGKQAFNRLKQRARQDKLQVKKWTRQELSDIRKKIKQLK